MKTHFRSFLKYSGVAAGIGVAIYLCFGFTFWSDLSFAVGSTQHNVSQVAFGALTVFAAPALWLYDSHWDASNFIVGVVASFAWGALACSLRLLCVYLRSRLFHHASNRTNVA
jgi:hypothetical protein